LRHFRALALLSATVAASTAGIDALPAGAATNGFTVTGSLNSGRADAGVALLQNGRVLVVGGEDATHAPLASAELYDAGTGQWSLTAAMPLALTDATTTVLANGEVLVAGGMSGTAGSLSPSDVCLLYDPSKGVWTTTGSLPVASGDASAVLLDSGKVLYVGGLASSGSTTSTTATSALYEPATGKWSVISGTALGAAVERAAVAKLANGDVVLAGGETVSSGSASVTDVVERYSPTTESWSPIAHEPLGVADATASTLPNGSVLIAGGSTSADGSPTNATQLFDPAHNAWTTVGSLPVATLGASAVELASGQVLYAGGRTATTGAPTATVALFDSTTNQWTSVGSLLTGRAFASAIRLLDGSALITGGVTVSGVTAASELYHSGAQAQILTPSTFDVQPNVAQSLTIKASGTPTPSISEDGALPNGLSFHDNGNGTATIAGTPALGLTGTYRITIVASNGIGTPAIQQLAISFVQPPRISSSSSLSVRAGSPSSFTVTATGVPTPSLSLGSALPAGLSFHDNGNGTATISGTAAPTLSGTTVITVIASNGVGTAVRQNLSISISPAVALAPSGNGYWYVTNDATVFAKGQVPPITAAVAQHARSIVKIATTHDDRGYYLVSSFGGVFNYGDARWFGSIAARHLPYRTVAFATDPLDDGYYIVTSAGNVFNFGHARWYGSTFRRGLPPIAAFALTPDGRGYWLVTTHGNIYAFGDATFFGSPAREWISPVQAFAPTPDGRGYWVVTASGNVLCYGDAPYLGSLSNRKVPSVIDFAPTLDGHGYWLATVRGNIFNFGDARWFGSSATAVLPSVVTGFAAAFS
jgi:N-acetylneuraminic acid mutarotase